MAADPYEDEKGDVVIEMDILPPRWIDIQADIVELLELVRSRIQKLDQLHRKHLLLGFDDDSDRQREKDEIERMTTGITALLLKARDQVQGIGNTATELRAAGRITETEERLAMNMKMSLAAQVGDVSSEFRRMQTAYLKSE